MTGVPTRDPSTGSRQGGRSHRQEWFGRWWTSCPPPGGRGRAGQRPRGGRCRSGDWDAHVPGASEGGGGRRHDRARLQPTQLASGCLCGCRLRGSGLRPAEAFHGLRQGEQSLRQEQQLPRLRGQCDAERRQGGGGRAQPPTGRRPDVRRVVQVPAGVLERAGRVGVRAAGPSFGEVREDASRSAAAHAASPASLGSAPAATVALICVAARVVASCAACHSCSRSCGVNPNRSVPGCRTPDRPPGGGRLPRAACSARGWSVGCSWPKLRSFRSTPVGA